MSSFAIKTLFSDKGKLLTAVTGVVFSLVLINIQGGLFFGLMNKASVLTDGCDADIWVGHRLVENVDFSESIPEVWLNRIRGLPNVQHAEPYIVGKGMATLDDGGFEDVWILGVEPEMKLGCDWTFTEGTRDELLRPYAVSVDTIDEGKLGAPQVGDILEISRRRAKVVAKTSGLTGFLTNPYILCTMDSARGLASIPAGYCSYFLVKATSQSEVPRLKQEIAKRLPDLEVLTAAEFGELSQGYWMKRTGIGVSFGSATVLGLFVGLLMVGQSLSGLVLDHIGDYATLKAIGAGTSQVTLVVILQAICVATIGSIIGVISVVIVQMTWMSQLAPIDIPDALISGAVVLVFAICLAACVLPILRIRKVEPTMVLQG